MGKLKYVVPSVEDFKVDPYLQAPHLYITLQDMSKLVRVGLFRKQNRRPTADVS